MSKLRTTAQLLFIFIILPVLVSFITRPFMNEWSSNNELSRSGYAVIANEYPTLSVSAQAVINQRMSKGYLIQKDSEAIFTAMLEDRPGGIKTYPAPDLGDMPESILMQVYRNIFSKPTESNGKDILIIYSRLQEH